ncbi:MAG: hypothetical protein ACOC8X_11545 [Chloroflexota bacterium]
MNLEFFTACFAVSFIVRWVTRQPITLREKVSIAMFALLGAVLASVFLGVLDPQSDWVTTVIFLIFLTPHAVDLLDAWVTAIELEHIATRLERTDWYDELGTVTRDNQRKQLAA